MYTAPTAIRAFMKWGDEHPAKHDLSSLRLLGTVGEPINPEAWIWYHENIGRKNCPIVDTWWQTETGAIMISPLPGVTTTKPGSATMPLPGIAAEVVDDEGKPVNPGGGGFLAITRPWPSMATPSGVTTSGLSTHTGRGSPASTSPAMGPRRTKTDTSGCWAASTM